MEISPVIRTESLGPWGNQEGFPEEVRFEMAGQERLSQAKARTGTIGFCTLSPLLFLEKPRTWTPATSCSSLSSPIAGMNPQQRGLGYDRGAETKRKALQKWRPSSNM